jgi:three-Cys-motif partner protein
MVGIRRPKTRKREFGGKWTLQKLQALEKYLPAYTTILTKSAAGKHLSTVYVDAFAGTGKMKSAEGANQEELFSAEEAQYLNGSAARALAVEPGFDRYIFIELKSAKTKHLEKLKAEFPKKSDRIEIHNEDANDFLLGWCKQTDWRKTRAVVFLDPFAMNVSWNTIKAIGSTHAIDLWYLFPCGAFNRLLTKKVKPPTDWAEALTRISGTDAWETQFYRKVEQEGLFGLIEFDEKISGFEGINSFFRKRLQEVFVRVADKPLVLVNSRNTPIFMLFFAAGNERGAIPAIKIANWIIEHGGDENKYRMD